MIPPKMTPLKVFKFEIKNILRSQWLVGFILVTALLTEGLNFLTEDRSKVLVSLSLILPILVPLVVLTFSTLHWYYNERFTVLLLTQPVSRSTVLWGRYFALSSALTLSFLIGILAPFIFHWQWPEDLGVVLANTTALIFIFVGLALVTSTLLTDRLKGIGLALGAWIYFSLVHDGILLFLLIAFRELPLDNVAGVFSALNPISLSRVLQLLHFDQALLLNHTGALTQQLLQSWKGYGLAMSVVALWIVTPVVVSLRNFRHRDL
jgi:Cu-processing system permease protein